MAQEYSRLQIIGILGSLLPTNGQEMIEASDLREALLALLYSTYNKTDDSINNNFTTSPWNSSLPYPVGFIVEYQNKFWKSKIANNTNIVPVEGDNWTEVSKAEAGQNINLQNYFTKLELLTAGQSQVHWNNITNVPALGGGITINRETLSAGITLDDTSATYQFLDTDGANRTIDVSDLGSTIYKIFVIKNIGTGNYLRVNASSNSFYVNENEILGLVWDGIEWQEV